MWIDYPQKDGWYWCCSVEQFPHGTYLCYIEMFGEVAKEWSDRHEGYSSVERGADKWLGPITPESFMREQRYRQALDTIRIMACEMNWGRIQKVAEDALKGE